MSHLFCFGLGYSARALARVLAGKGWRISGTATSPAGVANLAADGYGAFVFDGSAPGTGIAAAMGEATHVLVSAPPGAGGDPVLAQHARDIARAPKLAWIGYLSTVGVYGDWQGAWVDEETPPRPTSDRARRRVEAEEAWLALGRTSGQRVEVFRLSGIYGPGRSAIDNVRDRTARRILKPGQVFNRIHVEDIARVLEAAITAPHAHAIYNVTDDEPAPPAEVVAHAAALLGAPVPPAVAFEEAELSPMARSFYADNRRVRNDRIKAALGVRLTYPTYREGLAALAGAAAPGR